MGDVEAWVFMPALPVHNGKVNPFNINTAADQLRQIALADPALSHVSLVSSRFTISLNSSNSDCD